MQTVAVIDTRGDEVLLDDLLWGSRRSAMVSGSVGIPAWFETLKNFGLVSFNRTTGRYTVHHDVRSHIVSESMLQVVKEAQARWTNHFRTFGKTPEIKGETPILHQD